MTELVYFIIAVTLITGVHEFGHYAAAKICGVKVKRYSIGFGKVILSRYWRGTRWCVSLIPLGGYVSMLDSRAGRIKPADLPRAFDRQHPGKKIIIYLAGPAVNFIAAIMIFWGLNWTQGVSDYRPAAAIVITPSLAATAGLETGDLVVAVNSRKTATMTALNLEINRFIEDKTLTLTVKTPAGHIKNLTFAPGLYPQATADFITGKAEFGILPFKIGRQLGEVQKDSPAFKAGLRENDIILAAGGQKISDFGELTAVVRNHPGQPLALTYRRGQQEFTATVIPAAVFAGSGLPAVGRIGVKNKIDQKLANINRVLYYPTWLKSLKLAAARTWQIGQLSVVFLAKITVGKSSLKRINGPLAIASYAGQTAQTGLAAYLLFLAVVSISIGVLNLLPVPILDGGGVVAAAWEWGRGKPLSPELRERGLKLGLLLLIALAVVAFYNDFIRILG